MNSSIRIFKLAAFLALASACLAPMQGFAQNAKNNLETARKLASSQSRYLLLIFSSDSCPWCKKLKNDVLYTSGFRDFAKSRLVCISSDTLPADEAKKLKSRFGVSGIPATIVLNPDNLAVLGKITGFRPAPDFIKSINSYLPANLASDSSELTSFLQNSGNANSSCGSKTTRKSTCRQSACPASRSCSKSVSSCGKTSKSCGKTSRVQVNCNSSSTCGTRSIVAPKPRTTQTQPTVASDRRATRQTGIFTRTPGPGSIKCVPNGTNSR